jgi:uncharacterized membrane-anchored protein
MTRPRSAARKLIIVAAVQFLILFAVLGFKQYTVWTGETVLLRTEPVDPRDPFRGDFASVRYEISTLDVAQLAGDDYLSGTVYVELREDENGYAVAVAVHEDRDHAFDDTLLIKGRVIDERFEGGPAGVRHTFALKYGIEDIFIPEDSGADLPSPDEGTLAVEVKVDRFGNAVARGFMLDGRPLDLSR